MLVLAALLSLTGCRKSYPGVEYVEDEIPALDTYDRIPIIVAVKDPLMVSSNRGLGPLDDDSHMGGHQKWLKTHIYLYAFLAHNNKYSGIIDYRMRMDDPDNVDPDEELIEDMERDHFYCLVSDSYTNPKGHGKKAVISPDQNPYISWVDNEAIHYNLSREHQWYRYNFFAYHIDDAIVDSVHREPTSIALDLTINGRQDIMQGVASLTDDQIKKLIKDGWNADDLRNLPYSTRTGNRDVIPVVNMQHMMSRFSFKVTGQDDQSNYVAITNVYVKSKNRGRMVVAADDTTKLGLTFPNSLNPEREYWPRIYLPVIEGDSMRTDGFTQKFLVKYGESVTLGEDLLLPAGLPADEPFTLVFDCEQTDSTDTNKKTHYSVGYVLTLDNGRRFEAGVKYTVNVNVFGKQPIIVELNNAGWLNSVDINLGEEDMNPYLAPAERHVLRRDYSIGTHLDMYDDINEID